MAEEVLVRLLGGFSVSVGDVTDGIDGFRQRTGTELVQVLALAPGRRRHREQVMDTLWPDATVKVAANRLYQAASHTLNAPGSPDAVVLKR